MSIDNLTLLGPEALTFKGFMEIEERSPHTIRQYLDIIGWFEDFLINNNLTLETIQERDLIAFQMWLKKRHYINAFETKYNRTPSKKELIRFTEDNKGITGRSLYKYLTTIKKFLEVNEKKLNWTKIPTPKYNDDFNPEILKEDKIIKIAETASKYCSFQHKTVIESDCKRCRNYQEPKNFRAAAQKQYPETCFFYEGLKLKTMILVAYEAALRTDELCNLKVRQVNLEEKELFVEKPLKHSQQQAIPLSTKVSSLLKQYISKNNLGDKKEEILFPTKTGKKYHPNNFSSHVFRPIAKLAGYDVRYYTLRHSRATNLLRRGLDIGWVRRITRHRNINNVLKYIHLSSQDLREELERKELLD
jgi:integrase